MAKKRVIVYWLIPAKPYRELFRDFIRILARELDAPRFEPHLTVCSAPAAQVARRTVRTVTTTPVILKVRGVGFSEKFTKTLFVRFAPNAELRKLAKDLAGTKGEPADPHLSLVYKKLATTTKRELARDMRLSFRNVVFDSIKAVSCLSPTETEEDVKAWRLIAKRKLAPRHKRPQNAAVEA
jgi:hypothetical protein